MKIKSLALAAAALLMGQNAVAQQVTLSPVPQQVKWESTKAFDSATAAYKLTGTPDDATKALLTEGLGSLGTSGIELVVGTKGDAAVSAYTSLIPDKTEGYYLKIEPNKVVIAGNDKLGTFYGVQTFLQAAAQPQVMQLTVTDWPVEGRRGIIEGFYGNPWSFDDRVELFKFMGANKMNFYIYGPKDDPYHHSQWYNPYPTAEAAKMKQLVEAAAANGVTFVWAMHPSNSISSDSDKKKALDKFEQMYGLGVRAFSIFFDDISAESVDNQVAYLNYLTDNFVKTHDGVQTMSMCPTQYNRAWSSGTYLSTLGKGLYPEIDIMWTGNSVVDMIQVADCQWFTSQTGRKPLIWLNYPVNDYGQHNLLMGPFPTNDNVADHTVGFCSNPMQYCEASKVALYSMADHLWNPAAHNANDAWERSMEYLMPGHTDAFRTFCINNVDVAPSTHGLRLYNESPDFKALTDKYADVNSVSAPLFTAEFAKMQSAGEELLALTGNRMVDEIREFIQYFAYQGARGQLAVNLLQEINNPAAFIADYKKYTELTDAADALVSRNFSGSIQSVQAHTGTLYVEPWIKNAVQDAVLKFKATGAEYPADLFPAQVLEAGNYYIKYNGKYLSDVDTNSAAGVAGTPNFRADRDEINPGRQIWTISIDGETGRYKIINEWKKRYINELGNFGSNQYEAAWHTYNIYRFEGKFAIQNAGSAGNKFWTANDTRVNQGSSTAATASTFIFEIVPVEEENKTYPMVLGKECYLLDSKGQAFTFKGQGQFGAFEPVKTPKDTKQLFKISLDTAVDYYRIDNVGSGFHCNENGKIGFNGYSNSWNTYIIRENGAMFSIQNTQQSGTGFWVPGDSYSAKSMDVSESYLTRIVPFEDYVGISEVEAGVLPSDDHLYDLSGRRILTPAPGFYVTRGRKVLIK